MTRKAHSKWVDNNCFHIETELGIINIYVGLSDTEGHRVESVEILPDKKPMNPQGVLVDDGKATSDYLRVRLVEGLIIDKIVLHAEA